MGKYKLAYKPTHHRASDHGGVGEHVLIAEKALGRRLLGKHPVHHMDGDGRNNQNSNLVICESDAYHKLLHARLRIYRAGGNPNLDKICTLCRKVKPRSDFPVSRRLADGLYNYCKKCRAGRYALSPEGRRRWDPELRLESNRRLEEYKRNIGYGENSIRHSTGLLPQGRDRQRQP